ncbi:MAG TPA: hypothetical protein VH591_23380 [Ktedonobacterales bacterium]
MSNSQGNKPAQSSLPTHEPSLDTLTLAEWLAELRAAGDVPPLSALIAALPDAAGELADATMLDALVEEETSVAGISEAAMPPELSPGTQRAVVDIFGARDVEALAMVAETPASYEVTMEAEAVEAEAVGLLALAHGQGMDVEALAAQIMLSPDVLRWLDRVTLPLDDQPDALVFHLVGALGLPRERVRDALRLGITDTDIDASDLAAMLTTSASLTPAQRAYWAARLAGRQ